MANNWLTEKAQKERRESEKRSPLRVICGSCLNQRQKQRVDGTEVKATGRINANVWMKLSRNSSLLVCLSVGLTLRGTV